MSLDINTPRGQSALNYEHQCISMFCSLYPDYRFLETDKNEPAAMDGFFYLHKNNWVDCAVEVKTRDLTTEKLVYEYGNKALVDCDKIAKGQLISELICCPFVLMFYLIPEKKILTLKLTDKRGRFLVDFDVRKIKTKANINGGEVKRKCAFIPMDKAKEHKCYMKQSVGCVVGP